MSKLTLKGRFLVKHIRNGRLLGQYKISNGISNEGKNLLLDVMFHGETQIISWYLGLIDSSGFSALAAGDTMASHAGWTELDDYDETTRQEWNEAAASNKIMSYSTYCSVTINATKTVKGLFVTSDHTIGGTSGVLWSSGLFDSAIDVVDDDVFEFSYEVEVV